MLNWQTGQSIKIEKNDDYYKVIQKLGDGKNASAFLCLKTTTSDPGTFYVLKLSQHPNDERKNKKFKKEISILERLSHNSLIKIYDKGYFNNNEFYVTDFYPHNLSEFIRNRSIKLTQKLSIAIQLCSAIHYLSSKDIIHCDIKPSNIYTDGLKCVLADFGLAIDAKEDVLEEDLPSLHKYRSPDIVSAINNGTKITSKSDIFQLGIVLAELFTGSNPCKEEVDGKSEVKISAIKKIHGKFEKEIKKLLTEMLDINPANRPIGQNLIDRWQTILFEAYKYILEIDRDVF